MTRDCFGALRLAAARPILLHACSATVRFLHSWVVTIHPLAEVLPLRNTHLSDRVKSTLLRLEISGPGSAGTQLVQMKNVGGWGVDQENCTCTGLMLKGK